MISYFTKMFQAVPALAQLEQAIGGGFVTTRSSTKTAIMRQYPNTQVSLVRSMWPKVSSGFKQLNHSQMIITGSPNNSFLKQFEAKKAMVFHGTFAPLSVEEAKAMAHFDELCVIGPRMMRIFEQADLAQKASYCGYLPFLEYPEKDSLSKKSFLASIGLAPSQPLILYLPCGRPLGSWQMMAQKLLQEVPREYNLILRPHPSHTVTSRYHDRIGYFKLQMIIKQRGNAYLDLTSQKLSFLNSQADLVISDGTSPAEESLYYDVPQIFVETSNYSRLLAAEMFANKGMAQVHIQDVLRLYDCGASITPDATDIPKVIDKAISQAANFAQQRADYFEFVFGETLAGITNRERKHQGQKALIEKLRQYA